MVEFSQKLMIPIPNFLEKINCSEIKLVGINDLLLEIYKKQKMSLSKVAEKLEISSTAYSDFISGRRSCSNWFLFRFSEVFNEKMLIEKSYQKAEFFSKRYITKLPKTITPKLAYYSGYLQGAGSVFVYGFDERRLGFFDEYQDQIRIIKKLTFELFGIHQTQKQNEQDVD